MDCKLCLKKFSNGKALGGHMRSHFAILPLPPKNTTDHSSFSDDEIDLGENPKKKKTLRMISDLNSVVVNEENELFDESTRVKKSKKKKKVISDEVFTENDVALCLVMLSKDVWGRKRRSVRHKCEKCNKVFKSSQGLGSHMNAHYKKKKIVVKNEISEVKFECSSIDLNLPPPAAAMEDEI